jgi:cobaltochelatase CobN
VIVVCTNIDSDVLALRSIVEALPAGFAPVRVLPVHLDDDWAGAVEDADAVVVRLLGGRGAWPAFGALAARCHQRSLPLLAFGGEATPDAELAARSTADPAVVAQTGAYLAAGGLDNLTQALRRLSDAVLGTSFGALPVAEVADSGLYRWSGDAHSQIGTDSRGGAPTIGLVFYRAHVLSGNTQFVDDLCAALVEAGASPVPVWCYSLRPGPDGRVPALELLGEAGVDAVITTVLAMGSARGDDWDASALAALDVPIVQALALTRSAAEWEESPHGLTPIDAAMNVAIPEFDGRIISVPFSFKERVDDGRGVLDGGSGAAVPVSAYRTRPDRVARVAGTAVRLARLRHRRPADKKIAVVLCAYPTKRSRLGNAVGLDTPASVIDLLHRLQAEGYRVDRIPASGDELMAELADGLSYDLPSLDAAQRGRALGTLDGEEYRCWFETLPTKVAATLTDHWGAAPGEVCHHDGRLWFSGVDLGGVVVAIQPPRGFGENPVAVYHDPDLPPTHHYLAFYRWLDERWGADAIVHMGKHGTLEWLQGKSLGLSAACWPDVALGDVPLFYPFVVNDPGEGTQAKRRAHAVVIDHLVPPMTRAGATDDLARLESLMDTYAQVQALDPAKLPAVRRQVWDLLTTAELHRDLGVDEIPDGDAFDELIGHVDGYLCELKDSLIRGGLHTFGRPPTGDDLVDLVTAIARTPQAAVPSLRATVAAELGIDVDNATSRQTDHLDEECRQRILDLRHHGWAVTGDATLDWIGSTLMPALARTTDETDNLLAGLAGRFVPAGPSGSPTRGMAHVLPTGRNFWSVDPRAVPSPFAWDVGRALADALIAHHTAETGAPPTTVGIVVWGTAAMRTAGDDVAEILALLGVRPRWHPDTGRVTGIEAIGLDELGRARVDVVVRISGFFRDAFPDLVTLIDDAVELVGALDEPADANPVRAAGTADARVFGPRPGGYGSGILPLLESGEWDGDDDLAAVYEAWGGFAYGRDLDGLPAPESMRRRFAAIDVAVKNQDSREHDIFDSDDYLQDHGGMIATVRALTGESPAAAFGDSADPHRPRVHTLAHEAARVVRSRVLNPKWIDGMRRHGYKGAFEMAATVDYLYGYDATAHVVEDWMYERVTDTFVADPELRKFFAESNPWALRSIAERLLEAARRGLWDASDEARATLTDAVLEAEGWEESRG